MIENCENQLKLWKTVKDGKTGEISGRRKKKWKTVEKRGIFFSILFMKTVTNGGETAKKLLKTLISVEKKNNEEQWKTVKNG